jgi:hypothetical protein
MARLLQIQEKSGKEDVAATRQLVLVYIRRFDAFAIELAPVLQLQLYTARRVLAAVVYYYTYEQCQPPYSISFCWEICGTELHDNKRHSMLRSRRQHPFESLLL